MPDIWEKIRTPTYCKRFLLPLTCESQSGRENQMERKMSSHCDKNSAHNVSGKYIWMPLINYNVFMVKTFAVCTNRILYGTKETFLFVCHRPWYGMKFPLCFPLLWIVLCNLICLWWGLFCENAIFLLTPRSKNVTAFGNPILLSWEFSSARYGGLRVILS